MRVIHVVVCAGVVAAVGFGVFRYSEALRGGSDKFALGPTVQSLQRLNELVTLKVQVSDVLTAEGHRYRGAWLIKGDALIAVDLDKADIPWSENTSVSTSPKRRRTPLRIRPRSSSVDRTRRQNTGDAMPNKWAA